MQEKRNKEFIGWKDSYRLSQYLVEGALVAAQTVGDEGDVHHVGLRHRVQIRIWEWGSSR